MREIFEGFSAGCAVATPDFWSDVDFGDISTAVRLLYGRHAKTAAAWCAICARSDGRSGDFKFWVRVFEHLGPEEFMEIRKQKRLS
ncbi:hypothetical protein CO653_20545 [Rhizobium anhuiense]|nr:hypothetical protein CO653_20545 [Rhizobium anhuiense]